MLPYPDSANEYKTIEIPGASGYNITFSPESRTEHSYDFVRFYKDDRHNEYWGENKYSGGQGGTSRNFPGVDGHPPLVIPASKFVFHFQSDGSRNDWGYKIIVTPHNETIAMENSMRKIETLVRLHENLTALSKLDAPTRSIDEALIKDFRGIVFSARVSNALVVYTWIMEVCIASSSSFALTK